MIQLNIKTSDLQDKTRFTQVVTEALRLHLNSRGAYFTSYLEDDRQYTGKSNLIRLGSQIDLLKTDLTKNTTSSVELIAPKAKYVVDISTALFIGIPPQFSYINDTNTKLKLLEQSLNKRDFGKKIFNTGKGCSQYGVGYLLTFNKENDEFPRFAYLNPKNTNVVYDCSVEPSSVFGFYFDVQTLYMDGNTHKNYIVTVYTETHMFVFETESLTNLQTTLKSFTEHAFGEVPITEFVNNEEKVGDAKPAYTLIDHYNEILSMRKMNVEDVLDYILMLKNVDVGDEEQQSEFKDLLKNRILALKGNDTDAKFLTNPLNQDQVQRLSDEIDKEIFELTKVPNFNSQAFSQSSGETALQTKMLPYIYLVNEKERNFTNGLKRVLRLIKNYCEAVGNKDTVNYSVDEIVITYTHNLPSNDREKISQIVSLKNIGLLDPLWAVQQISTINDYDGYLNRAKEYTEYTKKLDSVLKQVNNNGVNDTNIERQNEKDTDLEDRRDNVMNNNMGESQNIS